jgi:hypothetical protein
MLLVPGVNPVWTQFIFHKILRLFTPYWAALVAGWALLAAGRQAVTAFHPALGVLVGVSILAMFGLTRFRRVAREGWLLQVAIVVAAANGLRGRWDVWQR